MTVTVSLTESQIFTALGGFLASILPAGTSVIQAQINRVPQPIGPDYVVMTALDRSQLSLPAHSYVDPFPTVPGSRNAAQSMQASIQCDVYGPSSDTNAQAIVTLWRDEYASEYFAGIAFPGAPLWSADAKKAPMVNAEMQFEPRWIVDLMLQCNITVGVPMDFVTSVNVQPVNVDAAYPPGA